MKKKEQASKSDVAHFDGLLGIWPSTPPTPSKWWSSAAPRFFNFWCQCDWSNVSITGCNVDDEGVMVWRLLSQLKAGFCLLPLRYICETTWYCNGHRFHWLSISTIQVVNDRNGQNEFRPKPKFRPSWPKVRPKFRPKLYTTFAQNFVKMGSYFQKKILQYFGLSKNWNCNEHIIWSTNW